MQYWEKRSQHRANMFREAWENTLGRKMVTAQCSYWSVAVIWVIGKGIVVEVFKSPTVNRLRFYTERIFFFLFNKSSCFRGITVSNSAEVQHCLRAYRFRWAPSIDHCEAEATVTVLDRDGCWDVSPWLWSPLPFSQYHR